MSSTGNLRVWQWCRGATVVAGALVACMVFVPDAARAEEAASAGPVTKDNNLTINPLGVVLGGVNLSYSHALGDHISLGAELVVLVPLLVDAYGVGGAVNFFYWPRAAHNGFFVGPYVGLGRTWASGDDSEIAGALALTPGVMLGWRWLWEHGFNVGLGLGAGYNVELTSDCPEGYECKQPLGGFAPRVLLDIGFAF
jgi:hypothetical protein